MIYIRYICAFLRGSYIYGKTQCGLLIIFILLSPEEDLVPRKRTEMFTKIKLDR